MNYDTSINSSTQVNGSLFNIVSCRGCDKNLSTNNPAAQYQRQKIIQNTVRVPSSLYTMNLGALSAYKKPLNTYQVVEQAGTHYVTTPGVNWNQMSDRPTPSIQRIVTGSGSAYGSSSTHNTIVRNRPGAMSPGGIGVDIKHNSYDRYLRRLKGQKPLRRGIIPPNYGEPIKFNRAYPVYGGKIVKTSIINNCNCPNENNNGDILIYESSLNAIQDSILNVIYKFNVGDFVFAKKIITDTVLYKAQIISIENSYATIKFVEGGLIITTNIINLNIYYACDCDSVVKPIITEYLDNEFNNLYNDQTIFCDTLATIL